MGRAFVVEKTLGAERWQPLYRWELSGRWERVIVGGAFHSLPGRRERIEEIAEHSLMPAFCHTRRFPEALDDRWVHSAGYVKMPLVLACGAGGARGLWFPPVISIGGRPETLHFSVEHGDEGVVFELGLLLSSTLWRKGADHYAEWDEHDLRPTTHRVAAEGTNHQLRFVAFEAASWQALLDQVLDEEALGSDSAPAVDHYAQLRKTIAWLGAVRDPESRLFLEWKWRGRAGFKGGRRVNLPCYHTLAGDLQRLATRSDAAFLGDWADDELSLALEDEASVERNEGRVWWNTRGFDGLRQRPRFRNHLGVGLAGYPGGQATLLRSLLEAKAAGARAPGLEERVDAGLRWLLATRRSDGSWPRLRYDLPETSGVDLPEGEGTGSLGGTAEGAWTLLLASKVQGELSLLRAGLESLRWVSEAAGALPVGFGYLRDNHEREAEGVSLIFACQAALCAWELSGDDEHRAEAERFGIAMTLWQRYWERPSFDPMAFSFGPRIAPCETAWAAEAYEALYQATGADRWRRLGDAAFSAIAYEDDHPGYSEACYYDEHLGLHPHHFECVYTASAVLRHLLQRELAGPLDEPVSPRWWRSEAPSTLRRARHALAETFPVLRRFRRLLLRGRS